MIIKRYNAIIVEIKRYVAEATRSDINDTRLEGTNSYNTMYGDNPNDELKGDY